MKNRKILVISVIVIILVAISIGNFKTDETSQKSKNDSQTSKTISDTFGKEFNKKNINDVLTESIVRASQEGRIDKTSVNNDRGMFYPYPIKKDSIKILNISDVYTYMNDEAIWQNVVNQLGNDFGQPANADDYPSPEICFVELQADIKTNDKYTTKSIVIQLIVEDGYLGGLGTAQYLVKRGSYYTCTSWEDSTEDIKETVKLGGLKKSISNNSINKETVETMVNQQLIELNEIRKKVESTQE